MLTFDRKQIDSAGAFLVGELERLDQTLHMPLASVTWTRDIDLREDVSMADESSSFTNSTFASAGGYKGNGKNWVGKDTTAVAGIALDIGKTATPLSLWAMELGYTIPELMSSQQIGRPIDTQKYEGLKLKYQMDVDEQVYIGDTQLGLKGLLNSASVTAEAVQTGTGGNTWALKTPAEILKDINFLLNAAWQASAFAVVPDSLLLPPAQYQALNVPVSTAGTVSILKYLADNSLCNAVNGKPLRIDPCKWLTDRGANTSQRACVYSKDPQRVRFPLVPMQRTPLEYRGIYQLTTYYGRLGAVEFVYPETVRYMDGL
jgi:hypothetical protein